VRGEPIAGRVGLGDWGIAGYKNEKVSGNFEFGGF